MVEVAENHAKAIVLSAKDVLHGDLDVVESDIRGPGGGRIRRLDLRRLDAFTSRDQQHRKAAVCAAPNGEVVGESSICDPSVQLERQDLQ